jgi:hypothetical protein
MLDGWTFDREITLEDQYCVSLPGVPMQLVFFMTGKEWMYLLRSEYSNPWLTNGLTPFQFPSQTLLTRTPCPFECIVSCALSWLSLVLSFVNPDQSDPRSQTLKNVNIFYALDISNKMHLWVVSLLCLYILCYLIHVLTIPGPLWRRNICM